MKNELQEECAGDMSMFSQSESDRGRMTFWSESVNAAEVKKGGRCQHFRTADSKNLPFGIGRDA